MHSFYENVAFIFPPSMGKRMLESVVNYFSANPCKFPVLIIGNSQGSKSLYAINTGILFTWASMEPCTNCGLSPVGIISEFDFG